MTDSLLRSLQRSPLADPGALLAATLRAGHEPSLDLLARAADAAGRPRPVLWLCMRASDEWCEHGPIMRDGIEYRRRHSGEPIGPRTWETPHPCATAGRAPATLHRVSVDLGLVAQAGRVLEESRSLFSAVPSHWPDGEPALRRGLPLRSPCGSASYDVSQVRLRWAPGPVDGGRGWCERCAPEDAVQLTRSWVPDGAAPLGLRAPTQGALERALGLACAVPHPWDRRQPVDAPEPWQPVAGAASSLSRLPAWVRSVVATTPGGLTERVAEWGWLLRLAAARIPLETGGQP